MGANAYPEGRWSHLDRPDIRQEGDATDQELAEAMVIGSLVLLGALAATRVAINTASKHPIAALVSASAAVWLTRRSPNRYEAQAGGSYKGLY